MQLFNKNSNESAERIVIFVKIMVIKYVDYCIMYYKYVLELTAEP